MLNHYAKDHHGEAKKQKHKGDNETLDNAEVFLITAVAAANPIIGVIDVDKNESVMGWQTSS